MLFILFVSLISFSPVVAFCPDGANYEPNSAKCYQVFVEQVNFTMALANCKKLGGDLASIHNAFENVHVQQYAGNFMPDKIDCVFWIGFTKINIVHMWLWTDDSSSSYTNWADGNPVDDWTDPDLEGCAVMLADNGRWYSDECNALHSYICEVPDTSIAPTGSTPKPPMCHFAWKYLASTDSCYYVNQALDTPVNHDIYCQMYGARLASVHSSDENDFIYQINQYAGNYPVVCYRYDVYIGLGTDGIQTTWLDGTAIDYVNYVPGNGNINNGTRLCYMVGTKRAEQPKKWYAEPCTNEVCGVCKMKAVH